MDSMNGNRQPARRLDRHCRKRKSFTQPQAD